MYIAKAEGRDRVVAATPTPDSIAVSDRAGAVAKAMRQGLIA